MLDFESTIEKMIKNNIPGIDYKVIPCYWPPSHTWHIKVKLLSKTTPENELTFLHEVSAKEMEELGRIDDPSSTFEKFNEIASAICQKIRSHCNG